MTILDRIVEVKKEEVRKLKRDFSISRFSDSEFFNKKTINIFDRIDSANGISIIAEIKKASPSKGIIRNDFNHIEIAKTYFDNNVEAVSVLTDEKFFLGSPAILGDIAKFKTAPLLRKDFILDEIQIYQSKSIGADFILLIAEILSASQISELTSAAKELGMEVLLELHSENQIEKIDFWNNKLIGINNRNLDSFEVNLTATIEISKLLPEKIYLVSESGIKKKEDIDLIRLAGTKAVLVGEHLMKKENIDKSIKELKAWCLNES